MGIREMGRHWSTKKNGKYQPVEDQRKQKKISKMRTTCKSHTNDKRAKGDAVRRKRQAGNKGPKPTNVKTFA